jgi:hypothetical protein
MLLLLACGTATSIAHAETTPPIEFVKEYIRQLGELESIRSDAAVEAKQKDADSLANAIHFSTRIELALQADIGILSGMHLDPPFTELPTDIIEFHKQKIQIHQRMAEIATEIMSGPKPGVDYGKMTAEMPKLRAILESNDEFLMKVSVMTFMTLLNQQPDKTNHVSRLIITKAERQDLLKRLQSWFGPKLDWKSKNGVISAAEVLRAYLRKDFKCTDDA